MSFFLSLSSDNRQANENTDDFTVSFNPPLAIPNNWSLALQSCGIWYSWYNVSTDYNNQTFTYYNGSAWKNIVIPNGLYSIEDLNDYIHTQMKNNGDYVNISGVDTFYINLLPNYNTFKLDITISNSYQIDLTVGTLYQLFGFTSSIVSSSQSGTSNINITNGLDKIIIRCDCIVGGYLGSNASDVLYAFQANGEPSSLLQILPFHLIYLPMTKSGYLNSMKLTIQDQLGRRVNLNQESVNLSLHLKRVS